jgi:hypothetical protein
MSLFLLPLPIKIPGVPPRFQYQSKPRRLRRRDFDEITHPNESPGVDFPSCF